MALEHDAPRFTLDQRDEILNLAARLQIQHESTVGVDDLFAEAAAAGIDPRFVQEATIRLGRSKRPRRRSAPLVPFVLFTLQACALMDYQAGGFRTGGFEWPDALAGTGIAFLLALWGARSLSIRRFVPIAPVMVWMAVTLGSLGYASVMGGPMAQGVIVPTALFYGLVQSLAAWIAVVAVRAVEWKPEHARSLHHYRGDRA